MMTGEWYLDRDRAALEEAVRKFSDVEIASQIHPESTAPESMAESSFPWPVISRAGAAGYLTGIMPENLAGIDLDLIGQTLIMMRMAEAAAGVAAIFAVHGAALSAAVSAADNKKCHQWITMLAEKAGAEKPPLLALAFAEPVLPLDRAAAALIRSDNGAVKVKGEYICLLTPETTDHTVLLVSGNAGESLIGFIESARLRECLVPSYAGSGCDELPRTRLTLDLALQAEEIIAAPADGRVMRSLLIFLSAAMIGTARAAARQARQYANERIQTGRVIIEHQEVRRKLSRVDTIIEAGLSMVLRVAGREDREGLKAAQQCYTFCGSSAEEACLEAIQTLGGYGYMKDYGLEKRLRDVKTLQALTGSYIEDWLE